MTGAGWSSTRAVVTGSSGFIGAHLVETLDACGARVLGIDRRPPRPAAAGAHLSLEITGAHDCELLADALAGADVVFHLAGRGGVRERGPTSAIAHHRDNVVAAARVLSLTPAGTPVVVTSSSSVYGGAVCGPGGLRACHEDDLPRPRSAYARAKVEVERLCRRRRERAGPVVVARPFTVVGPGQRPDMVVATWIDAARTGAPVRLFGSTEVRRDVTDVAEVARALVALAERPAPGVVNVGTGHAVTLAGLLGAVAAATGRPLDVAIVPAPAEDPPATLADTRRLARALGWVPRTDLVDVVARQAAAPSMRAPASASSARARLTAVERGRLRPPPRPRWRLRPPPRPLARADSLRPAPNLGR